MDMPSSSKLVHQVRKENYSKRDKGKVVFIKLLNDKLQNECFFDITHSERISLPPKEKEEVQEKSHVFCFIRQHISHVLI